MRYTEAKSCLLNADQSQLPLDRDVFGDEAVRWDAGYAIWNRGDIEIVQSQHRNVEALCPYLHLSSHAECEETVSHVDRPAYALPEFDALAAQIRVVLVTMETNRFCN